MTANTTTEPRTAVRLQRTIAAPPDRVYRAWLDPELMQRWMAGTGKIVTRAEVDERPGGHLRIWQSDGTTDAGGFDCEVCELVPGERIVLNWRFVGPQRLDGPSYDSRLTVTLRAVPDGTELTLVHERLAALRAAMPEAADNVRAGWERALDKLAGVV